jgi:uncharacterized protein YbaP (TraB family)
MPSFTQHLLLSLISAAAGAIAPIALVPAAMAQPPVAPPQPASQAPAAGDGLPMWVVRDEASTIYITGTVHMLPDGVNWLSPRLDAALKEADALYLELAEVASPGGLLAAVMPFVESNAQWDGPPLSSQLNEEERKRLADAFHDAETPEDIIEKAEHLQPWYAAYVLNSDQYGVYKRKNGIDEVLAGLAIARSIPVKGMERIQDQISLMIGLSPAQQLRELKTLLATQEGQRQMFERVGKIAYLSWTRGEINGVEGLTLFMKMNANNDMVLLNRNEKWAAEIEDMLKGSGVTVIAVGAAHLAGPDRLQSRLKLRGIKVERY